MKIIGKSVYVLRFHQTRFFDLGSTCGKIDVDQCLTRIADSINEAHKETKFVTTGWYELKPCHLSLKGLSFRLSTNFYDLDTGLDLHRITIGFH